MSKTSYEWLYSCPNGHQQTVRTTFSKRVPAGTKDADDNDIGDKPTVKTINTQIYCKQCKDSFSVTDFSAITVLEPAKVITADQEILGLKQVVKDLSGFDWQPEA